MISLPFGTSTRGGDVVVVVVVVVVGSFSLLQRLVRQKHVLTRFNDKSMLLSHCSAVSAACPHLLNTLPVPSLTETMQCDVVSGQIVTLPTSSGSSQPTNWSHSWQLSIKGVVVVVVGVVELPAEVVVVSVDNVMLLVVVDSPVVLEIVVPVVEEGVDVVSLCGGVVAEIVVCFIVVGLLLFLQLLLLL